MNAVVSAVHAPGLGSRVLKASGEIDTEFKGCCWSLDWEAICARGGDQPVRLEFLMQPFFLMFPCVISCLFVLFCLF